MIGGSPPPTVVAATGALYLADKEVVGGSRATATTADGETATWWRWKRRDPDGSTGSRWWLRWCKVATRKLEAAAGWRGYKVSGG